MGRALAVLAAIFGLAAAIAAGVAVVRLAEAERSDPARCGPGFVALGARCCAEGQRLAERRCLGRPASCPPGLHVAESGAGCALDARRVLYAGGTLAGGPDWQAEGAQVPRGARVEPFALDAAEVTYERWEHCVRAGACRDVPLDEPGLPVTGVDAREAERFCRFEGGRLPTGEEWQLAAMGPEGRRFPWGGTGLVCRRAAFGLVQGPCAQGGGLEVGGTRRDGATPEGVQDLAGNAAEWTTERSGESVARGGSYSAESASQLTSWSVEAAARRAPHIGFRCAFPPQKRLPVAAEPGAPAP